MNTAKKDAVLQFMLTDRAPRRASPLSRGTRGGAFLALNQSRTYWDWWK